MHNARPAAAVAGRRNARLTKAGSNQRASAERIGAALLLGLLALVAIGSPRHAAAEDPPSSEKVPALWTDPETGQVFTRPGRGRVPLTTSPGGLNVEQIEQQQEKIQQQQEQIQQQQTQLQQLKEQVTGIVSKKEIQYGGVTLKLGGFIEAAGVYRTRNEASDIGSDFNTGIPFNSSVQAHENETRFSARQSRLSLLATGDVNPETHLGAYYEMDFLSSGSSSNSRESNSYALRSRLLYATLDKGNWPESDWGFHLLAGQNWSLMVTNTKGIMPRTEQIPMTIDAQYVEGFNWLRVPQFRLVEDFGNGLWAGVSAESPQIVTTPIVAPGNVNWNNPGDSAGLNNPNTTYSDDYIPDFIGKIALDPGFGHYELKSIVRTFTAHSGGANTNATGWGFGGAAAAPIVPGLVDLQLSGLGGWGIGRYGSGQLPDAAFKSNNFNLVAIPEVQGLVGIITHPWTGNDLYFYGGWEHADRAGNPAVPVDMNGKQTGFGPGYGSLENQIGGCNVLGGICFAETRDLQELTGGFWQDIYKGSYGRFVVGAQLAEIWRTGFSGTGGNTPRTNIGIFMTSIRYYPFS